MYTTIRSEQGTCQIRRWKIKHRGGGGGGREAEAGFIITPTFTMLAGPGSYQIKETSGSACRAAET